MDSASKRTVTVLGFGGSTRPGSTSELALRIALDAAEEEGAKTEMVASRSLLLPIYDTESTTRISEAVALVDAVKRADALIVSSPGYHGSMSGMIKNTFDYLEDLRGHGRPYLTDMAVGCVAVASGWQATVATLQSLRSTVHALRGWPTPLGVVINSSARVFDESGCCTDRNVESQLRTVGRQVVSFAQRSAGACQF